MLLNECPQVHKWKDRRTDGQMDKHRVGYKLNALAFSIFAFISISISIAYFLGQRPAMRRRTNCT